MTGKTLTEVQIDKSTTTFVDDFCNANVKDSETTLIIAGLTAIIEGNESAMQKMKEQKWFQRIWYTLTGKNRVEVEEMKAKRDELSKYTIRLLVKMNQKLGDQTVLINDLYRSLSIVRNDVNDLQDVVDDLARKLNEKIISVDKYHNVLNDIRNGRFDPNKALISLIEIMSLIDRRTAGGTDTADRFKRIRETMENKGFDFASEINVKKHAEDVFSLPEEKVGSIYLFCQSCSNISKYLAYTCRLIENYFYCGETDRREVQESGEAVSNALTWSGLRSSSNCVVSSMYNDLENAVVTQAKEADVETEIDCSANVILQETPQNESSMRSVKQNIDQKRKIASVLRKIRAVVAGKAGVGKQSLINSIFEFECASSDTGKPVTASMKVYSDSSDMMKFYLTDGITMDNMNEIADQICNVATQNDANLLLYCVSLQSNRFEEYEAALINRIRNQSKSLKVLIVLTNCYSAKHAAEMTEFIRNHTNRAEVCHVLTSDYETDVGIIPAFGVDALIEEMIK